MSVIEVFMFKNNKKSDNLNQGQMLNDYLKCCKTVEKVLETKKYPQKQQIIFKDNRTPD